MGLTYKEDVADIRVSPADNQYFSHFSATAKESSKI